MNRKVVPIVVIAGVGGGVAWWLWRRRRGAAAPGVTPIGLVPEPVPQPVPQPVQNRLQDRLLMFVRSLDLYSRTHQGAHLAEARSHAASLIAEGGAYAKDDILTEDTVDRLVAKYNTYRRWIRMGGNRADDIEITDQSAGTRWTISNATGTVDALMSCAAIQGGDGSRNIEIRQPVTLSAFCTGLIQLAETFRGPVEWALLPSYTEIPGHFFLGAPSKSPFVQTTFTTSLDWAVRWLQHGWLVGRGRDWSPGTLTPYTSRVRTKLQPDDREYMQTTYASPWAMIWFRAALDDVLRRRPWWGRISWTEMRSGIRSMLGTHTLDEIRSWYTVLHRFDKPAIVGTSKWGNIYEFHALSATAPTWLRMSPEMEDALRQTLFNQVRTFNTALEADLKRLGTYYRIG